MAYDFSKLKSEILEIENWLIKEFQPSQLRWIDRTYTATFFPNIRYGYYEELSSSYPLIAIKGYLNLTSDGAGQIAEGGSTSALEDDPPASLSH